MTADDRTITTDTTAARQQLWDLVKDIRMAMFTTRHGNGHLHSRPMTTQNTELGADASLWFFMARDSDAVADLASDAVVNIAYADPGADRYVSISATAAVVADTAMKQQLWSKMAAAWFPGGATDPNLALVQARILHAGYWDVEESKIVQLFHIAKAVVTGKPPTALGEHAQIHLSSAP
jgi:general stress protein 26